MHIWHTSNLSFSLVQSIPDTPSSPTWRGVHRRVCVKRNLNIPNWMVVNWSLGQSEIFNSDWMITIIADGWSFFRFYRFTFALNSARKSKCFLRSVARMASMTRKRKRLNSTCSRLTRKLYSGRDMKRFHADAAWWFSKTERSLYRRAYGGRPRGDSDCWTLPVKHIGACMVLFIALFKLWCGLKKLRLRLIAELLYFQAWRWLQQDPQLWSAYVLLSCTSDCGWFMFFAILPSTFEQCFGITYYL